MRNQNYFDEFFKLIFFELYVYGIEECGHLVGVDLSILTRVRYGEIVSHDT